MCLVHDDVPSIGWLDADIDPFVGLCKIISVGSHDLRRLGDIKLNKGSDFALEHVNTLMVGIERAFSSIIQYTLKASKERPSSEQIKLK